MKSTHISKAQFIQSINTQEERLTSFACISITEPAEMKVNISPYWAKSLALSFFDTDEKIPNSFTKEMAHEVIKFLIDIHSSKDVNTLYVHCYAGISRSRAIHNFFQYYIVKNQVMINNPPQFIGNSLVYSTLVETYLEFYQG